MTQGKTTPTPSNLKAKLYQEFIAGQTLGDLLFVLCGLALQIVAYVITRDSTLSLICGLLGVMSIFLSSQRKISSFLFGLVQVGTYLILSIQQHLYGEMVENIFYLGTSIYAAVLWSRHYTKSDEGNQVEARRLTLKGWLITGSACLAGIAVGTGVLRATKDPQPLLDAINTVPAFIAQIFMVLRYREQWLFWLVVDALKAVMWVNEGNWCMAALFGFWTLNCIYGFVKWR